MHRQTSSEVHNYVTLTCFDVKSNKKLHTLNTEIGRDGEWEGKRIKREINKSDI